MFNATRLSTGGKLPDAGANFLARYDEDGAKYISRGATTYFKPSTPFTEEKYYPGTKGKNIYEPIESRKQAMNEDVRKASVPLEDPDNLDAQMVQRSKELSEIIESLQSRLSRAVTERTMVHAALEVYDQTNQSSCPSVPSRFDG